MTVEKMEEHGHGETHIVQSVEEVLVVGVRVVVAHVNHGGQSLGLSEPHGVVQRIVTRL